MSSTHDATEPIVNNSKLVENKEIEQVDKSNLSSISNTTGQSPATPEVVQPNPSPEIPVPTNKTAIDDDDDTKHVEPVLERISSSNNSTIEQVPERISSSSNNNNMEQVQECINNNNNNNNDSNKIMIISPQMEKLWIELKQKKEMLRRLDEELYYLHHLNSDLAEQTRIVHERMSMRRKDQKQLLDNYTEHVKSRRATDDDSQTIHKKILELKSMIKELSVHLAKQCDPVVATKAITSFWINLHEAILSLGDPLPKPRIEMLVEKFLMDVLIQNMNYNTFTGLKISSSYTQLQMWFERYDASFCTRFRQEIAKVVVSGQSTASDIQQEVQKFNNRMYTSLFNSLSKAFPFIEQHDAQETDPNLRYTVMLMNMVEKASHIGYAMRGQEIEIAAAAVGEGSEALDLQKMVDEDGQTSGTIQLCICPPFIVYGSRMEILEKARVLCAPNSNINDTVSS